MKKLGLLVWLLFLAASAFGQSLEVKMIEYQLMLEHYKNSQQIGTAACRNIELHKPKDCIPVGLLREGVIGYIDLWEGTFEKQLDDGFLIRLWDHQTMAEFAVLSPKKWNLIAGDKIHVHGLVRVAGKVKTLGGEIRVLELLDNEQIKAEMEKIYAFLEPQIREWKVAGKRVNAKFVGMKGGKVELENTKGKKKLVPLSDLSKVDVKEMKKEEAQLKVLTDLKTPRLWKMKGVKPFRASIAMLLLKNREIVLLMEDGNCQNFELTSLSKEDMGFFKRLQALFEKVEKENENLKKTQEAETE